MPDASEDVDLDAVYSFAVQLGKDAGAVLMKAAQARVDGGSRGESGGFEEKESAVDIVTKTDEGECDIDCDGNPPHSWRGREQRVEEERLTILPDQDVEAFIQRSIAQRFPSHKYVAFLQCCLLHITSLTWGCRFVGEESYSKGASKDYLITDEPTWCVDPLDGMAPPPYPPNHRCRPPTDTLKVR